MGQRTIHICDVCAHEGEDYRLTAYEVEVSRGHRHPKEPDAQVRICEDCVLRVLGQLGHHGEIVRQRWELRGKAVTA